MRGSVKERACPGTRRRIVPLPYLDIAVLINLKDFDKDMLFHYLQHVCGIHVTPTFSWLRLCLSDRKQTDVSKW